MNVGLAANATLSDRLALLLSGVLSPFLVGPLFIAFFVASVSESPEEFLKWYSICFVFSAGVPAGYICQGVYRGHITDLHVSRRDQRDGPFMAGVVGLGCLATTLMLLEAPTELTALSALIFFNTILFGLISRHWKISVHTGVLGFCLAAAIELLHWSPYWLLLQVPLVWARAVRGRHLITQGSAGAVLGYTLTVFPLRWLFGAPLPA